MATTFINKSVDEHILLALKHLLIEAKQRVPPFLLAIEDPSDHGLDSLGNPIGGAGAGGADATVECPFCSALGHRITECPKLEAQRRQAGPRRDMLAGGGGSGW